MKEMIYSAESKNEVLDTGFCFGLLYYILNLGTHPTAYIKIPKNHKLYGKSYEKIYKEVRYRSTWGYYIRRRGNICKQPRNSRMVYRMGLCTLL